MLEAVRIQPPHPHLQAMKDATEDQSLWTRDAWEEKLRPFLPLASKEELHLLLQHCWVKHLGPLEKSLAEYVQYIRNFLYGRMNRDPPDNEKLLRWEAGPPSTMPREANFISFNAENSHVTKERLLELTIQCMIRCCTRWDRLRKYERIRKLGEVELLIHEACKVEDPRVRRNAIAVAYEKIIGLALLDDPTLKQYAALFKPENKDKVDGTDEPGVESHTAEKENGDTVQTNVKPREREGPVGGHDTAQRGKPSPMPEASRSRKRGKQ